MPPAIDAIELTRRLVAFDTINPPGREEPCAEYLAGLLESAGLAVRLHPFGAGRASLIASVGGRGDALPIGFTGHLDTVPLGAAPWRHDPFGGEIADGRLYGRGSSDMKGGVAAFVAAACTLADRLDGTAGLQLVITAGEETGCEGAAALSAAGALEATGALVVAEPTSNQPFVGHKGALWLKGLAGGVTAHGSMPEKGVNAVYKAARAIGKLEDFDFNIARHPHLGGPTLNVGTVQGGMNVNSVPDRAEIGIDIRTIPGMDHRSLRDGLAGYLGEDIRLDPFLDAPGVWTDPGDDWVQQVLTIMEPYLGTRPDIRGAPYFTDASVLTPAMGGPPTVILGPGEPGMAHQTDENCEVSRLEQAVEAYRDIIARWCGI